MFADDTNLTASGDSVPIVQAAVNSDLENLRKWLIANKLSLNVVKTEFMLIGSKSMIKNISDPQPNVFINNIKQIKRVYECKTLGLTIDQYLSWKSNAEIICKKYAQQSRLFVESNLLLTNKHLFLFITPLSVLALIIAHAGLREIQKSSFQHYIAPAILQRYRPINVKQDGVAYYECA